MKGIIYKISNADDSIVYIGSSTRTLARRWSDHKADYKKWMGGKKRACAIYHSFKEHGIDAFSISLVSEHEIDDNRQLCQFEQLVIDKTKCCNKHKAYQPLDKKQYDKAYYDKLETTHCECGGQFINSKRARHMRSIKHQHWLASQ